MLTYAINITIRIQAHRDASIQVQESGEMQEVRHSKYTTAENLTSWLNVIGYLTKIFKKKKYRFRWRRMGLVGNHSGGLSRVRGEL